MVLVYAVTMPDDAAHYLATGQAALANAQWAAAKAAFESALALDDTPEAHDGLGLALWWLNEVSAAHEHRAAAYTAYKRRGDNRRAALLAVWLAREQVFLHSNASAMNGWFARAERLLSTQPDGPEQAWLALWRASMLAPPEELERVTTAALEASHQFADTDMEVAALAFGGLARVALGRVREGLNQLDEAMAAATSGEVASFQIASEVFCVTLSACELAGDWVRTQHWCQAADDYARRYQCSFLSAYCRTTYGGLLTVTGRWDEAETELTGAIRAFEAGHRGLRVHAVLRLADLRVQQGRLEEAAVLLNGLEDQGGAVLPLARLHLARQQPELARALLGEALRPPQDTHLGSAPLLALCVEALLACGDVASARAAVEQLAALAAQAGSDSLLAQADLARGRLAGEAEQAAEYFRRALNRLQQYEQSLLASRAKLALARALTLSDPPGALTWARAALATFQRLGAARDADEAAQVLRGLGAAPRARPGQAGGLTSREREVLALLAHGLSNRAIAARLSISAKTAEHHVSQILGKLGLRSRAEAAAYAAQQPAPDK